MTRSSTKNLIQPFEDPERALHSLKKLFHTNSFETSSSFELDYSSEEKEGEKTEAMTENTTMEEYMNKTRADYSSGIARPKLADKAKFELKGQFLKELRENAFGGTDNEDANEHVDKVLEIADLFTTEGVSDDQLMLRIFPISLKGAAMKWLKNEPAGSITTWGDLKSKFLKRYCPPAKTAKKMEAINNFKQEPDETLYQAWERFKDLLMKCPQHYLNSMQEIILFYQGLDVPTRQILDAKGAVPQMSAADARKAIQEAVDHSQKWHDGTSTRSRSSTNFDEFAAIQAQLDKISREMKKRDEKAYAAQVGCEKCKGPHYTKDCPLKKESETFEEAFYTQFGQPFQPSGRYREAAPGYYQRNNNSQNYQERRQTLDDTLKQIMADAAKRHEENSNMIKEIRASTDTITRNQGASIKALEQQIGQMSKVLQERGIGSLPGSTETNPKEHVKALSAIDEGRHVARTK